MKINISAPSDELTCQSDIQAVRHAEAVGVDLFSVNVLAVSHCFAIEWKPVGWLGKNNFLPPFI